MLWQCIGVEPKSSSRTRLAKLVYSHLLLFRKIVAAFLVSALFLTRMLTLLCQDRKHEAVLRFVIHARLRRIAFLFAIHSLTTSAHRVKTRCCCSISNRFTHLCEIALSLVFSFTRLTHFTKERKSLTCWQILSIRKAVEAEYKYYLPAFALSSCNTDAELPFFSAYSIAMYSST